MHKSHYWRAPQNGIMVCNDCGKSVSADGLKLNTRTKRKAVFDGPCVPSDGFSRGRRYRNPLGIVQSGDKNNN